MPRQKNLITGPITRAVVAAREDRPVTVGHSRHAAEGRTPLFDMHYPLEMGVVLAGRTRRIYRDAWSDCAPGDVWFCGIWEPHGYQILAAPCETLVFVVWPPLLVNLHWPEAPGIHWMAPFVVPVPQRPRVTPDAAGGIVAAAQRAEAAAQAAAATRAAHIRLAFLELLLQVIECDPARDAPAHPSVGAYQDITPALQLALGARRLVTNVEAARACGLSRDRFIRAFRRLMGVSFAKFALRRRLGGAADQLVNTQAPIKAVAAAWGFTDPSHLHRLFVAHYGCSPRAFRRQDGGWGNEP